MTDRPHRMNEHGQPIGLPVDLDLPRPFPPHTPLEGRHVRLVALDASHAPGLYAAFSDPAGWTYLGDDTPYADLADAEAWTAARIESRDPLFYTVLQGETPVGFCTYLRIDPKNAAIEIGYIHFSPLLQGTIGATEAQYLMMRHVFEDLGYRRYEWKCDALNAPSRAAALRLGFTFEGIFRQAVVYKGRNRDTAWYSVIDADWPNLKAAFEAWLSPENFDANGAQKARLQAFR